MNKEIKMVASQRFQASIVLGLLMMVKNKLLINKKMKKRFKLIMAKILMCKKISKMIPRFSKFNNPRRYENINNETGSYRIFMVFELKKGTIIPNDIGIEIDGNNHVCLYPTGNNILISDIEEGLSSFAIDALKAIEKEWKLYALFQVRSCGFAWPEDFPSDSEIFPFRQWISFVIKCGESDIAIDASNHIEDYLSQQLDLQDFLLKMIDISYRYSYDCTYDHIDMNRCVLKALRFALNINSLVKERR